MFQELSAEKFKKVDRRTGLDMNHLKVSLKHLAKLHAASAALPDETFSNHQQPNISEYFKVFHPLFVNCVKSLVEGVVGEAFEGAEVLASKLSSFESNMIDRSSEAFMLQPDDFGVLCHGDLWLNNLLFMYDDDSIPVDVRMVSENECQ
jgi:thiamine kinase-like enzyme